MTAAEEPEVKGLRPGPPSAPPAERAPAKLNLYLHLRGRRPDGYHLLESLAVFPGVGDMLRAEPAKGLSLSVSGPFGDMLGTGADNLVLRAAEALRDATGTAEGAALHLEKVLPVASGIGGGSADAAAALRLLSRLWGVGVPDGLALSLGADVPVCMGFRPRIMEGIGERLSPAPPLPPFWVVLVNPMTAVPTGKVFGALECRDMPPATPAPDTGFAGFGDFLGWLKRQRNDLEPAALACCPAIADVLEALASAPLARMSGSGATCFALYPDEGPALAAAARLRDARPGWWIAASPVAGEAAPRLRAV